MYSSRSVPGSWKSPSPSLMKPRFSSRRRAASSALNSAAAAACGRFLLAQPRDRRGLDDDRRVRGRRGRRRTADRRQVLLRFLLRLVRFGRGAGSGANRSTAATSATIAAIATRAGSATFSERCAFPRRARLRSPAPPSARGRHPSRRRGGCSSSSRRSRPRRARPPSQDAIWIGSSSSPSASSDSGSRRLRSSRSSFSGNAARITRQLPRAPATMPRTACLPAQRAPPSPRACSPR